MAQRPTEPNDAALDANRRGVLLRSQGRLAEAIAAFREGVEAQPGLASLRANLAMVLAENGDVADAKRQYRIALDAEPDSHPALAGMGSLCVRLGEFDEARRCYESLLARDPDDVASHQAMYELEQIAGNNEKALLHQRRVLERKTLFSERAPNELRRLLALMAPGDWQANVPVDFLIDRRTTTLHKLYVLSAESLVSAPIPAADAVFTAIAESDENRQALGLASELVQHLHLPAINLPDRVLRANRVNVAQMLSRLPDTRMPQTARIAREALIRGETGIEFPLLVRPVGSQAGRDLERIGDPGELSNYLERVDGAAFFVMPFIDFRSQDGFFRKYRVIVVDGIAYPYHLAISPHWMIHYYNAPMRENQWMRDEEARFLAHFEEVVSERVRRAMRRIAYVLDLQYVGLDCTIDREGHLLVFEADPAMVVHAGDDPALFGYKFPAAYAIFDAFQRMIDRVRSR
jgi:glutathione synthase/RimK-type ligase-like ATP-grasp enzyme